MTLEFINQNFLLLLLIVPVIYYFYNLNNKKKKKQAIKFSHLALIKNAMDNTKKFSRINVLFYLILLSIVFLIIGLANPHIPLKQVKEGVNVVLVIDNSGSMQATDYSPNRLEAAKNSAEILINSLNSKDHVGIVVFESGATTAAYLSPFKDKAKNKLKAISAKDGKTAIGDGLSLAVDMATSIPNKKKVIILLSDGVSNAGVISPDEATIFAKMNKIQVYTIGMGSEGNVVLGYDWFGNPQYAELDEQTLINIAQQTGGQYFKAVDTKTLDNIYNSISKDIEREKEPTSIKDWFVIGAILLLLAQFYLRYGKGRIIQ